MMQQVLQYLERLSERERRIVQIGAVAASLLLIIAVLLPLQRSVHAAAQRIERKRDDLTWLRSVGPQLADLRTTAPAPLHDSLVVLVDRSAREAGIGKALVGSQPSGNGGLNVRFEQAPFDSLMAWLSQLGERYGVHAESASIDAANTAGTVNAALVLRAR